MKDKTPEERLEISRNEDFPITDFYDSDSDAEERLDQFWSPWVILDSKNGVGVRTHNHFKQPNQPIQIKSCYNQKEAKVTLNYHQFIELWRLILTVGEARQSSKSHHIIEKLTGKERFHVTLNENGLMIQDVYLSHELCEALCDVGQSPERRKLINFFKYDIQTYPKYVPGFLM